jgi:hypothetical protein
MRVLTIVTLLTFIVISSCQKADFDFPGLDLAEGEITLNYVETQCADPWHSTNALDTNWTNVDKVNRLLSYFENEGVEVIAVQYEFNEDEIIACLECNCASGGVYYVKIKNDEAAIEKLMDIGFHFQ